MSSSSIGPTFSDRESCEPARLSPITKTWSSGTVGRAVLAAAVARGDDLRIEVRLDQLDAVDEHDAVAHLDRLALQGDDPLDEIALRGAVDLVEHDDVTAVGIVQPVGQLVDEHPVAVVQRVVHRVPVDDEVGEHEGAHEEGDEQRHADDDDPVDEPAGPATGQARHGLFIRLVEVGVDFVGVADGQLGVGERLGAARMGVVGHLVCWS